VRPLMFLLAAAALPALRGADIDKVLKGVEERYNTIKTMQANFVQTFTAPGRKTAMKGMLFLRKPGRMRWQYSMPEGMLWVSDGEFVYSYDPRDKRAEKSKLKDAGDLRAPVAFLLGKLNFHEEFRQFDSKSQGDDVSITAYPKSDKLAYTEVHFLVSPNFVIKQLSVKGQDGSLMEYSFEGEKKDPLLTEALFKFTAPPGVEVVDATKGN
jgi:outer membrane lipoprotein carrier protein